MSDMSVTELREVIEELTPSQRTRLVRLAVTVSRNAGYCDEPVSILNLMGFKVPEFRSAEEVNAYHDPQEE